MALYFECRINRNALKIYDCEIFINNKSFFNKNTLLYRYMKTLINVELSIADEG